MFASVPWRCAGRVHRAGTRGMRSVPIVTDAAALALIIWVCASRGGARRRRVVAMVLALVIAAAGALVVGADVGPQWEGIVSTATLVVWFYAFAALMTPRSRFDGWNGSGSGPPAPLEDRRDGSEPSWWPRFERDFRAYAARQARKRQRHLP